MTKKESAARQQVEPARAAGVANVLAHPGGAATRPDLQAPEMSYEEALALQAAGGAGRRQILTPAGWIRVA